MNINKIAVLPRLPEAIRRLDEIANNLWWSWETEAQALFARLNPTLWDEVNHNPIKLLHRIDQSRLDEAAADPDYLAALQAVLAAFDAYMNPATSTWYDTHYPDQRQQTIAYFSAEFGLHEALPIYSGGLGVLSGDHCKAASDLGLPFIGVGFLYPQGYFNQQIDGEGRQQAQYEKIDFAEVPARPALDQAGQELLISVDLPGRVVYAKIWRIQVGRIPIFLMDTDVPRNAPQDRELSARLYGGDREMRISQEVVLGIGGVRAVAALGYQPAVWHMNEGHSAFLGLERVRRKVQDEGLSFDEAVEAVRANTLFTTHTPVPAGNDSFAFELVDKFFWQYWGQLGVDRERFIEFARQELPWGPQYSMTVLALRLSRYANGVSALHGEVSRAMWRFMWPETPTDEVPIGSITNGIHTQTWLVDELKQLYTRHFPADWEEHIEDPQLWEAVDTIDDGEFWAVHQQRKEIMIRFVRNRLRDQYLRHGEGPQRISRADHVLDPNALIIGFARRFATYKRATLLFHDLERIKRILDDPARPVQIVFSGKAHPDDEPGKALIQQVYTMSQQPEFAGKIVFLENYDMNIARHLISGVDVWINTPRRPREASGTSGQKAALSGVPNFSVLDGWWVEGYDATVTNGWTIGEDREYKDLATQDDADAYSLYTTLENEIIPLFFDRGAKSGVPVGWVRVMKNAVKSCAPTYSMRRMVIDYTRTYYLPAADAGARYHADHYALSKAYVAWRANLRNRWPNVRIEALPLEIQRVSVGDSLDLQAKVWLPGLAPDDVVVEAVIGGQTTDSDIRNPITLPMIASGTDGDAHRYHVSFSPDRSGPFAIGLRIRPQFNDHGHVIEPGFIRWA
jgi:starch phosphorylase